MRFFTCVVDPEGRGIPEVVRRVYEVFPHRRGLEFRWYCRNQMAVLTGWDDPYGDPLMAQAEDGDWIAVGTVRLDNRPDLARWAECDSAGSTDLELVRRVIARHGTKYVSQFLGDFAFVAWNGHTRTAVAACDTFAVCRLYCSERQGLMAFASRAEALALDERYEVQYLVEAVSLHDHSHDLTVYAGVRPVPRASMAILHRSSLTIQHYWDPADFDVVPSWTRAEQDIVERCRHLLEEAVRLRTTANGGTWAQLSGGLDSSSVVSLSQWLTERGDLPHGLAGTVTFVDHHGTGTDEREYSDAVVSRWRVRNERIIDPPTWYDDRCAPPRTDQPGGDLHVYPRDSRLCTIIRASGGRTLLTGVGGDELFAGSMLFFADWLIQGRVWMAVREMARRAAIGRVSYWELAYRNALVPLLPRAVHHRLVHERHEVPALPWLRRETMRQYGLTARPSVTAPAYGGPLGHKYHHAIASMIARLETPDPGGLVGDSLDVRHPFLYRPLVEFALHLPPELRARPHAHRWVLREAMRGILPEVVRTRVGKAGTAEFLGWSLATQRSQLAPLVEAPILGELGIIDSTKLRSVFDDALHRSERGGRMWAPLLHTLAVEAWLQIRCGRWPRKGRVKDRNGASVPIPLGEGNPRRTL